MRLRSTMAGPVEPLWADVAALHLVADVLHAAFERHGLPKKLRRRGTKKDMPEAHLHVVDLFTPNEVDY